MQAWPGTFIDSEYTDESDGDSEEEWSGEEYDEPVPSSVDEPIEPTQPTQPPNLEQKKQDPPDERTRIPSLVDLTLRDALKQGIDSDNLDQLETLPWLAERVDVLAEVLHEYSPFPDAAVPLLAKLIQGWKRNNAVSIDLSGFNITDSQLQTILPEIDGVRTLNLSRNPSLTTIGLELVLERLSHLRRLLILSCPGIDDFQCFLLWMDKRKLFGRLDALYWELFQGSLQFPPELSLVSTAPFDGRMPITNVMIASPAVVVQTLTTFWKMFEDNYMMPRGRVYEVAWSLPMTPDQTWDERGLLRSFLAEPWSSFSCPLSSWIVIINPHTFKAERPREWGFFPYRIVRRKVEKPEKPEGEEKAGEEGDIEDGGDKGVKGYELIVSIGKGHTLQEYLHRIVEEDGKIPASEEAVEQLEALINRLGVGLIGKDTLVKCLFNHR